MSRFDECLPHILKFEGGYVNRPEDHGGATNKGITQSTYDAWCVARNMPTSPVKGITDFEVAAIYRANYWNRCRCDDLPPGLDLLVFDSAIQHGASRAVKWLQLSVGAVTDGICGDKTLYVVNSYVLAHRLPTLIEDYMDTRAAFYAAIISRDPAQRIFAKGWGNRMNTLQDALA